MKTWSHLKRNHQQKTASYVRKMQEKLAYLQETRQNLKEANDLLEQFVVDFEQKVRNGSNGQ